MTIVGLMHKVEGSVVSEELSKRGGVRGCSFPGSLQLVDVEVVSAVWSIRYMVLRFRLRAVVRAGDVAHGFGVGRATVCWSGVWCECACYDDGVSICQGAVLVTWCGRGKGEVTGLTA
jgi:hypothetical protein